MAPKADGSDTGVALKDFHFVLDVLESAGAITPDWKTVAEKNGIGYARNAGQKFRELVKKHGFVFQDNTLRSADADADADGNPAMIAPSPKRAKTPRTKKIAATGTTTPARKKRKVKQEAEEDEAETDKEVNGNDMKKKADDDDDDDDDDNDKSISEEGEDDAGQQTERDVTMAAYGMDGTDDEAHDETTWPSQ